MQINIAVVGDRAIALKFAQIPLALHDKLLLTVRRLTLALLARIQAAEPTLSGKLQSKTKAYFTDRENLIRGAIRPGSSRDDKLKALALEFGAHGTAAVKAYTRASDVTVQAYRRHVNIQEHRFLRGPFDEMRSEIENAIRKAFQSAAETT
jgi:hypothetical protein